MTTPEPPGTADASHDPAAERPAMVARADGAGPALGRVLTRVLIGLLVVLGLLVAFLGGVTLERYRVDGERIDAGRLNEVADIIERDYYRGPGEGDSEDTFDDALENGALVGLAAGAGDPYTAYLPPDDAAPLAEALSGQYGGIGVTVEQRGSDLVVIATLPDGPAERAGIRGGDVLLAVDGTDLAGASTADAGAVIRGDAGTTATVVVLRPSTGERLTFTAERARLDAPIVTYAFDPATGIGHLRVSQFSGVTTAQLDRALAQATADGATGLVLDLRGNGGGSVISAQELLGRFLSPSVGPALYETTGRQSDGGELISLPILAAEGQAPNALPMVVLVDGGTASASEIVAATLSDYGRATVMGSPTFGKGSVQRVHTFADESILRVTIAEWLTPAQRRLDGIGVPIAVPVASGDAAGSDLQFAAAVAFLRSGGTSATAFGW